MTVYFIYLCTNSTVQASITPRENEEDIFIGEVECNTESLITILTISQMAADMVIVQLNDRANEIEEERLNIKERINKKDLN